MTDICEKTKICSKCNIEKPLNQFAKDVSSIDGLRYWCKECSNKHRTELRYGHTTEYIDNLYKKQKGCCACCGEKYDKLAIDHDHITDEIRGLLCYKCNTGIGQLGDNITGLLKGLKYLIKCYIRNKFRKKDAILDVG